jgi:hypothetical protein
LLIDSSLFLQLAQLTPSNLKRNGFGSDSFSVEDIKRQDAVFVAQRDQVDELRASQASFRRAVEHFDRDLLKGMHSGSIYQMPLPHTNPTRQ